LSVLKSSSLAMHHLLHPFIKGLIIVCTLSLSFPHAVSGNPVISDFWMPD
jgi:hypothetical protein